jgi:hypothetical protein
MSGDWDHIGDATLPLTGLSETTRTKVTKLRKVEKDLKAKNEESAADLFARQCRERRLPAFIREYHFAAKLNRGWKFDFCWVYRTPQADLLAKPLKLAVEIEGIVMRRTKSGEWIMSGRHATIGGFKDDCIKYATAAMLDWRLMRFEQSQVKSGFAVAMVMRSLARNGWKPRS